MSYDFELYASRTQTLADPPELDGGNIVLDGPDRVEVEDLPREYLSVLGKKRLLYRIHLEGEIGEQDRSVVNDWLRALIIGSNGILIDQQTETFEAVDKSGSVSASGGKGKELGSMSFVFEDGERFYASGFENMLARISETLSAAMPTRYGYYEPLQGKTKQGEYSAIVSDFQKDTALLLKSPSPFGHISLSVPCDKTFEKYHPHHFLRRHHLLGSIRFELRPRLFANPSLLSSLEDLFKALCVELDVVYAEVLDTAEPETAWFWYGLPSRKATHAICVGPAYQDVWPESSRGGELVGGRHRVFFVDRFGNTPPKPPSALIAPDVYSKDLRDKPQCAPIFPFDYEFDVNKYIW